MHHMYVYTPRGFRGGATSPSVMLGWPATPPIEFIHIFFFFFFFGLKKKINVDFFFFVGENTVYSAKNSYSFKKS
jgi:hypothetical protein